MLGAPLETLTVLHHAEALAQAPGKRFITSQIRVAGSAGSELRTFHDIDTSESAYPFGELDLGGVDGFEVIARDALAAGIGVRGAVGEGECHLFDARRLTKFAISWIENRFGA